MKHTIFETLRKAKFEFTEKYYGQIVDLIEKEGVVYSEDSNYCLENQQPIIDIIKNAVKELNSEYVVNSYLDLYELHPSSKGTIFIEITSTFKKEPIFQENMYYFELRKYHTEYDFNYLKLWFNNTLLDRIFDKIIENEIFEDQTA